MSLFDAGRPARMALGLAVPPREAAPAVAPTHANGRQMMSWQHFEEPSVHGVLEFTRVMWLAIGRVRAGAHRVLHDPRRAHASTGANVHVVLQLSGADTLEQSGRSLILKPGHWAVLAGEIAYTITSRDRTERLVMVIGRERLAVDVKPVQLASRAYSAASGTGRLFFSTAVCFADELPHIRAENAEVLAEQLTALLHIGLRHEAQAGSLQYTDVRRERVHRYISQHLRDPQLTVERVAAGLGWSRRTLARLLEADGETLMEHVYRRRLEGSRRDLLNPMLEGHTLADIARSWGFRNYSHFSDRFRSHFGLSPTAVRRRALLVHGSLEVTGVDRESL
jgi:AraC-like DNA-binding protein